MLILDGVVPSRKTGTGAIQRPVLVALGLTPTGRKGILDFRLAPAESQIAWETLLDDLHRRGLTGAGPRADRQRRRQGLLALPLLYPGIPVQRCCRTLRHPATDLARP